MSILKNTILYFILSFLSLCIILWYISFSFILPDYKHLQSEKNLQNIESLLQKMNRDIKVIKNITNDYSKWDDTYNFMKTKNQEYIYDNFRDNSSTVEDLNLDFILFVKNDNTVLFSKYAQEINIKNPIEFEKYIVEKIKNFPTFSTLNIFYEKPLYLIKSEIYKSDETGDLGGHIISGRFISDKTFEEYKKIFPTIEIINKSLRQTDTSKLHYELIKNIELYTNIASNVENIISFFIQNEYIFSIKTISDTNIIKKGFTTIIYYNSLISIILFVIFFNIYRYQKKLENYNKKLESKVEERTKELSKTLRTVELNNKKLYELSNTDYLTKIKNRRNFFEESDKLLKKAINEDKNFSVLMIDIDHFKNINDNYGHSSGDEVLKEFCKIVNSCISKNEIFGRLGGEEFCITFFDKNLDFVEQIGNNIRTTCETTILNVNNKEINFTISLGLNTRGEQTNIDEILHYADESLYKAKNSGRNRLVRNILSR